MNSLNSAICVTQVFMFSQSVPDRADAMQHIVLHEQSVGYWLVTDVVPDMLSPENRVLWDAAADEFDGTDEDYPAGPVLAFASIEDVIAWAYEIDSMSSIECEMSAFGAPSECGDRAYAEIESRICDIEKRAVGFVPESILLAQFN